MSTSRFDPRILFVFAVAVVIAYWLIIPKEKVDSGDQNLGHSKNEDTTNQEQTKQSTMPLALQKNDADAKGKEHEFSSLQADLYRSQEEAQQLQSVLKQRNSEIDNLKQMLEKKQDNEKKDGNKVEKPKAFSGQKLIHFDMKGAAPKMEYLRQILPFIKKLGATGLLVEYEDMYPYEGELKLLQSEDAYSKGEIVEFLNLAKKLELTVIPLVQTFGHMEFVLKHKKFAQLRETSKVTNSLCPLNPGSVKLVQSMVKDILRLHPDAEWLHLGGDEVWNLKTCSKCKKSPKSHSELYLHHMLPIFEFLTSETKGRVMPIIWDDMMRNWSTENLTALAGVVEPMVWAYAPNLETYQKLSDDMWLRYHKAFPKIWIASSFKGAKTSVTNYVPIQQHIDNHLSWMKIISRFPPNVEVLGIAMTGWSRFDHYASLCELLPVGVPSMAFCLSVLKTGGFNVELQETVSQSLGFKKKLNTDVQMFKSYVIHNGTFPGHDIFWMVSEFEKAYGWFLSGKARDVGWARDYQLKNNHVSHYQLEYTSNTAQQCINILKKLKPEAYRVLSNYFSKRIVNEWIADKIEASMKEAMDMKRKMDKILKTAKT